MTSVGTLLNDECLVLISALSLGVPTMYGAAQAGQNEYILFLDDDERDAPDFSDKDDEANDLRVTLQFWGADPRVIQGRAKSVIDRLRNPNNPPILAGFTFIRADLERNRAQPALTTKGQDSQYSRVVQIRFIYYPT